AFGEGRHARAVDLARQAHAVDAARVEADPLVYKMHLLSEVEKEPKGWAVQAGCALASPPVSMEPQEQEEFGVDGSVLVPHLPGVSAGVSEVLDAVLMGVDGLAGAKK